MSSRISDLANEVRDIYIPNNEEDLPYIGLEHVEQESLHLSSIGSSQEVESHKFRFKLGDILFGTLRPYFRKVIIAPCDGVCSTEFCVVRVNDSKDLQFVFYGMASTIFIKYATTNSKGARPRTKWKLFSDFELPKFLPSQRQDIGNILSAYDDLIENNRRRIQLLEQAVRLLYKEWFVHLRFPGHEHVTITDGVPEGWEKKKIADVCETVGGGTPSTKVSDYWDGDITWVVPSDITKNDCLVLLNSERKITEKGLRESSAKMVPAETILMTSRASVGFFALMDFDVCTNQGFINVVPHEDELRMYLLFNFISRVNEIRSNAKGTTYPEISKGRFRGMDIIIPSKTLINEFGTFATDIIQQERCLKRSILQLEAARDLLLPRLMNGDVVV